MKKILMLALMLVIGAGCMTMEAQSKEYRKQTEANQKQAEKLAKKQAKELKKQKWEYTGVLPLEAALASYYLETVEMCGGEKQGQEHEVNNAKSISIAEKRLLLDAQTAYAQEVQTMLGADLANQARSEDGEDFETYVGRVAAKVMHEFNGDVRRSILLKKRNPDGKTWTVRGYFIIDERAGAMRAKRIAEEVEHNNGMIDSIHEKVFGEKE